VEALALLLLVVLLKRVRQKRLQRERRLNAQPLLWIVLLEQQLKADSQGYDGPICLPTSRKRLLKPPAMRKALTNFPLKPSSGPPDSNP